VNWLLTLFVIIVLVLALIWKIVLNILPGYKIGI